MHKAGTKIFLVTSVLLVALCTTGLFYHAARFHPYDADDVSYLFQAKLFSQGRLYAPAPPEFGFSPSENLNISQGKWYSKYPPGHALFLTLGEVFGCAWLMPVLSTSVSLLLLFYFVRAAFSLRIAIVSVILALLSPATLGLGAAYFSESTSRFALGIFMLGFVRLLTKDKKREACAHARTAVAGGAGLVGLGLGLSFLTRPQTAVAFAIPSAFFFGCCLLRCEEREERKRLLQGFCFGLLPFSFFIGLYLAWNALLTGHPLKPTFNAVQPYEQMGFGLRGKGYYPEKEDLEEYTPPKMLRRILLEVIPRIGFDASGWGLFRSSPVSKPSMTEDFISGVEIRSLDSGQSVRAAVIRRSGETKMSFARVLPQRLGGKTVYLEGGPSLEHAPLGLKFRLEKRGNSVLGFYRKEGWAGADWVFLGEVDAALDGLCEVGVFNAVLRGDLELKTKYDYFEISSNEGRLALRSDYFNPRQLRLGPQWHESNPPGATTEIDEHGYLLVRTPPSYPHTVLGRQRLYQLTSDENYNMEVMLEIDPFKPWLEPLWLPALLPFVFAAFCFTRKNRQNFDFFLLGIIVCLLTIYGLWFFDISNDSFQLLYNRYYGEGIFFALLPLVAKGMLFVNDWIYKRKSRVDKILWWSFILLLLCSSLYSQVRAMGAYARNAGMSLALNPEARSDVDRSEEAVYFVPWLPNIPWPGDYPFMDLQEVKSVVFRLGPSKLWGLADQDWREVYKRYFRGRKVYIFDLVRWEYERAEPPA